MKNNQNFNKLFLIPFTFLKYLNFTSTNHKKNNKLYYQFSLIGFLLEIDFVSNFCDQFLVSWNNLTPQSVFIIVMGVSIFTCIIKKFFFPKKEEENVTTSEDVPSSEVVSQEVTPIIPPEEILASSTKLLNSDVITPAKEHIQHLENVLDKEFTSMFISKSAMDLINPTFSSGISTLSKPQGGIIKVPPSLSKEYLERLSTMEPTIQPTIEPTIQPTIEPTIQPTIEPTIQPTIEPTIQPTIEPTIQPTIEPNTSYRYTIQMKDDETPVDYLNNLVEFLRANRNIEIISNVSDEVATVSDQVATVSDQVATVSDQVATVSDQVATVSDQTILLPQIIETTLTLTNSL